MNQLTQETIDLLLDKAQEARDHSYAPYSKYNVGAALLTAAELRAKFAEGMNVSPKNAMRMMQWALVASFGCMVTYNTPTNTLKKNLGITSYNISEILTGIYKKIMETPQSKWPGLILMMFEGDWRENRGRAPMFADGSRNYQMPKYKKDEKMELCYNWLTEFGYSMSTEEIEMMGGTHAVFQTEVEA